ncbi:response regulator transcription factor [Amycolatopsis magusensis]|uniref:response regulator transcription factor n=1 Tax=Amycolatopsis magusensis TaxID=882444 RepID=UPI0024A8EDFD|nr:response regulator transcription factor [Amycolatopsis magusensis]MDI5979442.1 response regulator transcription factor [Amycolatopsis magusensis]
MRILVVEDDDGVAAAVVDALVSAGHGAVRARVAAEVAALRQDADLVLLDLGLPDADGLDVLRELRRAGELPVLVMTARSAERDVVRTLRLGADDYLVKPVRLPELLARIEAVARRRPRSRPAPEVVEVGDVRIELAAGRVTAGAAEVALTGKEFDILAVLARAAGTAVSRQALIEQVWGEAPGSRALDAHVVTLRGKLDRPGLLATVRGFGYRLGEASPIRYRSSS